MAAIDYSARHRLAGAVMLILTLGNCCAAAAAAATDGEKFVTYTPYWGWSNQLRELQVAATWASYLNRTLVLPKFFMMRPAPDAEEPDYESCKEAGPSCTPFEDLIDVNQLSQYCRTTFEAPGGNVFSVGFGVDFESQATRTEYLIRWVDDEKPLLRPEYGAPKARADPAAWCNPGILVTSRRCMRSGFELQRVTEPVIHFPKFHTFVVGRIWSNDAQRRSYLNDTPENFIGPAAPIIATARLFRDTALGSARYNAVHVRHGDFLTVGWSKELVDDVAQRAAKMRNGLAHAELPLYIASDELDDDILVAFKDAGFSNVVSWLNFTTATEMPEPDPLVRSHVEQLICMGATQFESQKGSTFSEKIVSVRTSRDMMKLYGFADTDFDGALASIDAHDRMRASTREREMRPEL